MSVLIGNMVNNTVNNTLTLNYTNFPFYTINIYNLDNDEVQIVEMNVAITKPTNGIIYMVSNVDGHEDTYILALIFNSNILYLNNKDRFAWNNTNQATINLNLTGNSGRVNILNNFTVTINTDDYDSVDNGTYGVIDRTSIKGSYTKEDGYIEFSSGQEFMEIIVNETRTTFKSTITDYNSTNYLYTNQGFGGTIEGIIFNGATYVCGTNAISKEIIDDLPTGTIIRYTYLYSGNVYNIVTINSNSEISVTNTEA